MDYNKCSDETLARLYQTDNHHQIAVEILFERHKGLVRKKAKAMFLIGGDGDDLIQEGMIGLYHAIRDYDEAKEASFTTFASMCINRQIMSAVTMANRKKNIPLNQSVSLDAYSEADEGWEGQKNDALITGSESNPEEMYIDKEYTIYISGAIKEALSPMEQQVFDLHIEGKDYREIAAILDKSPKSIDNALQRIRNKAGKIIDKMRLV